MLFVHHIESSQHSVLLHDFVETCVKSSICLVDKSIEPQGGYSGFHLLGEDGH